MKAGIIFATLVVIISIIIILVDDLFRYPDWRANW